MVIDLYPLQEVEVRNRFPAVYQWVADRVKPERDQNNRKVYRDSWWIFGEPRRELRPALQKLDRYIATVETSKHRYFQFLGANIRSDEHTSELQSLMRISYAVFCLKQKKILNDESTKIQYSKSR